MARLEYDDSLIRYANTFRYHVEHSKCRQVCFSYIYDIIGRIQYVLKGKLALGSILTKSNLGGI